MTDDNDSDSQGCSVPTDPGIGAWASREAWESLPSNPDLSREFGYELVDWDVITQENRSDQMIFLPADQEALAEDAFIVIDEAGVCDVETRR